MGGLIIYDGRGKLIQEHSTIVETGNDAKLLYLTQDQLGSPRINTDAVGSVIARHDYQPFGEEISTAQRTSGLGYTSDTVRKKFTGYEQDVETELEFAQARYYKSGHGRFTSPDPLLTSASLGDPQSWNRYTYCGNSPLVYVDPTGLFRWSEGLGGDRTDEDLYGELESLKEKNKGGLYDAQIEALEAIIENRGRITSALATARAAAENPFLNAGERQEILDSVNAYGGAGVDNGVTVGINTGGTYGGQVHLEGNQVIVSLNLNQINANTVAHEGSHVVDAKNYLLSGHSVSMNVTEHQAYRVAALVAAGQSVASPTNLQIHSYFVGEGRNSVELFGTTGLAGVPGGAAAMVNFAKGKINANVDLHLRNIGRAMNSPNGGGSMMAFPAAPARWY